jgi:hypothetical protein
VPVKNCENCLNKEDVSGGVLECRVRAFNICLWSSHKKVEPKESYWREIV